jgi:hypothetical protein
VRSAGENPITSPAMMAARRIPLPVAESQLSLKTASSGFVGLSGVGFGTTGVVRTTTLCNSATRNAGEDCLSKAVFTKGTPQMKTSRLSRTHGVHAARILPNREWAELLPKVVRASLLTNRRSTRILQRALANVLIR